MASSKCRYISMVLVAVHFYNSSIRIIHTNMITGRGFMSSKNGNRCAVMVNKMEGVPFHFISVKVRPSRIRLACMNWNVWCNCGRFDLHGLYNAKTPNFRARKLGVFAGLKRFTSFALRIEISFVLVYPVENIEAGDQLIETKPFSDYVSSPLESRLGSFWYTLSRISKQEINLLKLSSFLTMFLRP